MQPAAEAGVELATEDAPPRYSGLNFMKQLSEVQQIGDPKQQMLTIGAILFGSVISTFCLGSNIKR